MLSATTSGSAAFDFHGPAQNGVIVNKQTGQKWQLTPRERDLYLWLVANRGYTFTVENLRYFLFGHYGGSEDCIRLWIKTIRAKIHPLVIETRGQGHGYFVERVV